ncbi:cytochrome P450 [Sphingomonas naphthae]|uniref:Cytochrome P450 n=1 Tax=Sphingomonas naphthae TaxID=1813468 RepID=A0ABY7TMT1_9SPHN|nr:cytochrome P450 [Sphingomonas naphthae]WCT74537.1 cytochrome P450 [Sphingomonas naphthae]
MDTQDDLINFPPPRSMKCPFDPAPVLTDLQRSAGIGRVKIWNESQPWLITRHEDVKAVFADESRVSADPSKPGYPEQNAGYKATVGADRSLRTLDNPEHDIQKRMIMGSLSAHAVEAIRPKIQQTVDGLIDDMLAKGNKADLVADFAAVIPMQVLCDLLGIPYADREFFASNVETSFSHATTQAEAEAAAAAFFEYLDRQVDAKLAQPDDALMSRLIHNQMASGKLTRQDVKEIVRSLVFAGTETTTSAIGLGMLTLLRHPDQMAEIVATDDRKLLTNAVFELMRYLGITHTGRRRVITAPVQVGDQILQPGEGVIIANTLADRDEQIFPDADRFDIHRPNAKNTLAFGYGVHQCPGQYLSRVEQQVVLATLPRRISSLRLAVPFDAVRFKETGTMYGLHELPVEWDA